MMVKAWVEFEQEVEVEVSIADVMSSIAELAQGDQEPMLIDCITRVHRVLKEVPQERIDAMSDKQRSIIHDAFIVQASRFSERKGGSKADSCGYAGPPIFEHRFENGACIYCGKGWSKG